jgi:hypothetical protein
VRGLLGADQNLRELRKSGLQRPGFALRALLEQDRELGLQANPYSRQIKRPGWLGQKKNGPNLDSGRSLFNKERSKALRNKDK